MFQMPASIITRVASRYGIISIAKHKFNETRMKGQLEKSEFYYPETSRKIMRNMELWKLIVKFRDEHTGKKLSLKEKEQFYSDARQVLDKAIFLLDKYTIPVTSIEQIAQVASAKADYSIALIIADSFKEVGSSGLKMVVGGNQMNDELEIVNGIQMSDVKINNMFAQHCSGIDFLEDSYILLYDNELQGSNEINESIEKCRTTKKPLIIIANRFSRQALLDIIQVKLKEKLKLVGVALKPQEPENTSLTLEDISILTETEISKATEANKLGHVQKCYFQEDEILLLGLNINADKLQKHISVCSRRSDKHNSNEKISNLRNCKTAIIKIGGIDQQDTRKRMAMAVDMLARADEAVRHGIIAADGRCLLDIIDQVDKSIKGKTGANIVLDAMKYFYFIMYQEGNCYYQLSESQSVLLPRFFGYDENTKQYINLLDEGIIDPKSYLAESLIFAKQKCIQYSKQISNEFEKE